MSKKIFQYYSLLQCCTSAFKLESLLIFNFKIKTVTLQYILKLHHCSIIVQHFYLSCTGIASQPVTLFDSPVHLTVNNYRLSMKCMPHKNYLNYKWERRGGSLPSKVQGAYTSNLIIVNLRPEDAGDYRCIVSNSTGTISSNFYSLLIASKLISIVCMHE